MTELLGDDFFTIDDEGEDVEVLLQATVKDKKAAKKKRGVTIPDDILNDPEIKDVSLSPYFFSIQHCHF